MRSPRRSVRRAAPVLAVAATALLAASCGGGDESTADAALAADPVVATAEANQQGLRSDDDVRLIEVLDVADGSVTTLREAVDGDRPVLLWFWAPH